MPSNSEQLTLWGLSDQSIDIYSLDGGPKHLIRWVSSDTLQMQITCNKNRKILFTRCSLPWCWCQLHTWEKVVSYLNTRYISSLSLFFKPLYSHVCMQEKKDAGGWGNGDRLPDVLAHTGQLPHLPQCNPPRLERGISLFPAISH
jgi:hypothetical protein